MELTGRDNHKAWVSGPLPPGLPTCLEPFLHCQVTDECIRFLVPPAVFGSDEEEEESEEEESEEEESEEEESEEEESEEEDKEKTKEEVAVVEHGHGGRRDVLHGGDDSLQWQLQLQHLRYADQLSFLSLTVLCLLSFLLFCFGPFSLLEIRWLTEHLLLPFVTDTSTIEPTTSCPSWWLADLMDTPLLSWATQSSRLCLTGQTASHRP